MSAVTTARRGGSDAARPRVRRGTGGVRRAPLLAALPGGLWMVAFFVVPFVVFAVYSFLTAGLYRVSGPLTTDSYTEALTNETNRTMARNSLVIGVLTASVCVVVGLPIAYWMRFVAGRARLVVLFLITSSMFASYLVRIYAWRSMLGSNGVINKLLDTAGVIDEPLSFLLYNRFAVVVALVHIYLPYIVLVLYAAMTPVSPGLLEAGRDLGAGTAALWRRVLLPVMAAPAFNAFVFVFILCAADYVTPQFLGGTSGATLGLRVQTSFITLGNWPLAAATSFLMLGAFVLVYLIGNAVLRRLHLTDLRLGS